MADEKWRVYRWIWRLESPLHIGMPPAGTLNRCRMYVPERAIHGAVAAELARRKAGSGEADYGKFSHEIGNDCRFSYWYPAEKMSAASGLDTADGRNRSGLLWTAYPLAERANDIPGYYVWVPQYEEGGFSKEEASEKQPVRKGWCTEEQMAARLLGAQAHVVVNPNTDSALEGGLREMIQVNPYWRNEEAGSSFSPVYYAGYAFLWNNGFYKSLSELKELFLGGDTRYGLGRLSREGEMEEVNVSDEEKDSGLFGAGCQVVEGNSKEGPKVKSRRIWGHGKVDGEAAGQMRGMRERMTLPPWKKEKKEQAEVPNTVWRWQKEKEEKEETLPEAVPWVPGSYITKAEKPIWRLIKQGQWMAVSGAGKGGNEKLVEKT